MSEPEHVNFDSPSGGFPDDGLRPLHDLLPTPLVVDRDELFFQAGFAAGRNRRRTGYFWPSAVAALLLICAGLGAVLVSETVSMNRMQRVLAATGNVPTQTVAQSDSEVGQQTSETQTSSDRFVVDRQQRAWLRLASAAPLPSGRLTAAGWEELPPEIAGADAESNRAATVRGRKAPLDAPSQPETAPRRPAAYFELMRQLREG